MNPRLAFQDLFRPALPEIYAAKDYRDKRAFYEKLDQLIRSLSLDELFVSCAVDAHAHRVNNERFLRHSRSAFRCMLVKNLEHLALRDLSATLADSRLFQWFCFLEEFGEIKAPSKSTLNRYETWIPRESLDKIITTLLTQLGNAQATKKVGLESAYDLSEIWIDTTCLKAHIHYPVDWVLLIDATRTLMKACVLIRAQQLKCRMPQSPEDFIRDMNNLGIAMSQFRGKDSKKARKKQLRLMLKMIKRIGKHAERHVELLQQQWGQTEWSKAQADQVIQRIQGVTSLLPAAQTQAEERMIHEGQVAQSDKIISLYDLDAKAIKRRKPGADTEFGNLLLIGEQRDGLITEWHLEEHARSDTDLVSESCDRLAARKITLKTYCGDRGFQSVGNDGYLEAKGIASYLLPRNPLQLKEHLADEVAKGYHKRRSQTEGRIAILKNVFLEGRPRVRGLQRRRQSVSWSVLTHNLWKVARQLCAEEEERLRAPAQIAA
jgi:IS5 family transposase